jgi:hypothetical protein
MTAQQQQESPICLASTVFSKYCIRQLSSAKIVQTKGDTVSAFSPFALV